MSTEDTKTNRSTENQHAVGSQVIANAAKPERGYPPELPALRRVVVVTDFDSGAPVTHTLELWKTNRVDVFRVFAGGIEWKHCGWSAVLDALRKAYPRVPSPRSDCLLRR